MAMLAELVDGVIGVDPHRDSLTAAAVTRLGGVLAQTTTSADAAGYQRLLGFAQAHLPGRRCWAVEGRAASAPGWRCSSSSVVSGSWRSADPSGPPVAAAPRATRWTRSGPPVKRSVRTAWPYPDAGASGKPCECC